MKSRELLKFSERQSLVEITKVSGRIPALIRFAIWIRANDLTITALTPR